ncbi:MAG: hypothetical protein LBC87_09460 [Fibromonadaceae bacterium]|jgi:hypothetical protein|nr:hypothetical protein [Fibromonadaceae bacterium]
MGKIVDSLPKLADPSVQVQDILAACQCIRENLESENAPKSLELLQIITTSLKENKLNILEHVKKIKSTFDSEVKTKREALFLPYKVSMWDSLENIYLTAKEDSDWDAFVMPIPYYDRKDGKFTEQHWEINYPKNIQLIDFQKYNIEERHPDVIFIHNPYDSYNTVTSVHPDFYSERLRKLTDCLVYVPYFVGNGTDIAEHFCTLPACIFAHKVIVQTEVERKIYVNKYKEFAKKNKTLERFDQIGDKFLALGSPKLDKAITTKRENYEISPEWEKLINNKKVVFYNLSIGDLLENTIEKDKPSDKYFKKVKSVFNFFKNQKDYVLLWRPHPLLEGTIKSMRPWLEREYAEIVNEYKAGGYGIYDDTDDLNRAIALSDMYYGDKSSVMKLFEVARKPVVGQAFEMVQQRINGIYDDGNFVWFINCFNILYRHNKQSKETECVGAIPAQNYWGYIGIEANNNKLYFAPYYKNNKISIFNASQKKIEQIDFKDDCKYDGNFNGIISFKNLIYYIPCDFPAIMKLNTDTKEIEYFSECIDELSKLQVFKLQLETWKYRKFFGFCVVGAEIALVIHRANAIVFFNMETENYEIKNIGEKSEQYYGICFDGQNYYIASCCDGYITRWNRQSNEILKIKIPSFSRRESISSNFSVQYLNGYVWLFPFMANNAYKINTTTNEITELPELIEHFEDKKLDWYYNLIFASGNTIYASTLNKGIVEYNTNTAELNFIKFDFKMDPWLLSRLYGYDNLENGLKTHTETANSGKAIWEHIKKVKL